VEEGVQVPGGRLAVLRRELGTHHSMRLPYTPRFRPPRAHPARGAYERR
jgi:hypothetical protein